MNSCLTRLTVLEVRAVGGEAEHGDRETHLRIDEGADIAANNGVTAWPIVDGCDAGVDEADRVPGVRRLHLALGGRRPPIPAGQRASQPTTVSSAAHPRMMDCMA